MAFDLTKFITSETVSINPHAHPEAEVNFLLRHDNWNNAVNCPAHIKYTINGESKNLYLLQQMFFEILEGLYFNYRNCPELLGLQAQFNSINKNCLEYFIIPKENNVATRQGTYNSYIEWKFGTYVKFLKALLENDNLKYPKALEEVGINKNILEKIIENIADLENIKKVYPSFGEEIFAKLDPNSEYKLDDTGISQPTPVSIKLLTQQILDLYSKYANINFDYTDGDDYQFNIFAPSYTFEGFFNRFSYLGVEQLNEMKQEEAQKYDNHLLLAYVGDDFTQWKNHTTQYVEAGSSFVTSPKFNGDLSVYNFSLSDISPKSFEDIYHGINHAFLDHPNDGLMFLTWEELTANNHELGNKLYTYLSSFASLSTENTPFSFCMSTMGTGAPASSTLHATIKECVVEGRTLYPITPMPLDLKALQHLYTSRCESSPTVFEVDGKFSPNLFGFDIQDGSIFTLFSCYPSSLDLSKYIGDKCHVDLQPGAGHFNIVGDNVFLFAYNTQVENVYLPSQGKAIIYTSDTYHHNIFFNPNVLAKVVLPSSDSLSNITLYDFHPEYHAIFSDELGYTRKFLIEGDCSVESEQWFT